MSENTHANEVQAEALRCLARGYAVMPLAHAGKEPHYEALKYTRATTQTKVLRDTPAQADEVCSWFDKYPEANLGILCGEPSRLAVLDYDGGSVPVDLMGSPMVKTGRGAHVYIPADGSVLRRIRDGYEKTPGLDSIRTTGHVVAPPSRHPSGADYSWLRTPEETSLVTVSTDALENLLNMRGEATPREPIPSRTRTTRYNSLAGWDWDEEFVRDFCALTGARLRGAFRCVLPGHTDRRASAAIWKTPDGQYVYKDFHKAGRTYLLVYVYASVKTGRDIGEVVAWPKPTVAQWKRRLIVELGFDTPAQVDLPPLPYGAPRSAQKVYEGIRDLLGVRWADGDADNPAPLTRKFLSDWCAMSEASVTLGKGFLIRHNIIAPASKHGRTRLWLPGKGIEC